MKKRIGAVLLVLGMLLGCLNGGIAKETEAVTVQVEAGNLRGSGVIYEKNESFLIVATAAHVLPWETEAVSVTFSDDFAVTTDFYYRSSHSDLAFINIPLASLPKRNLKKYTPVQLDKTSFDAVRSGDKVIFQAIGTEGNSAINSAYTGTVLENWIYVEDFGQYMMLLQGNIEPGMSGGGVFDEEGNFLGILCGESERGEVAVVPFSIIQAEYLGVY